MIRKRSKNLVLADLRQILRVKSSDDAQDDHHGGFPINRERELTSIKHLVTDPPSAHGGSKYQLVALSPACH